MTEAVIQIRLRTDTFDKYDRQAKTLKISLEQLLAQRLEQATDWTASKPLYFDDEQRRALEGLLSKNFNDSEEVISLLIRRMSISLNGVKIPIPQRLLTKIVSASARRPFNQFLTDTVIRGLEYQMSPRS